MNNKVIITLSKDICKNEAVSRFFGSPTVPGEWFDDELFSDGEAFICQIALADLTDYGGYGLLPTDGYIYFFYDFDDSENPLRIRFFGDAPDTVVEGFNESLENGICCDEYSVVFSGDTGIFSANAVSAVELNGNTVTLFDFSGADSKLFAFLGDKKRVMIDKAALKNFEFDRAYLK